MAGNPYVFEQKDHRMANPLLFYRNYESRKVSDTGRKQVDYESQYPRKRIDNHSGDSKTETLGNRPKTGCRLQSWYLGDDGDD